MKSKKGFIKAIDIIYWSIILFSFINEISKLLKDGSFNSNAMNFNLFGIKDYLIISVTLFVTFVFFAVLALLKNFHLTIIYVGIRIAYKNYIKDKLDEVDFKNDKYYREIISKYSPGVLSYIDDFKLDEKDIVATLMSLELKQKIKIRDTIEVINDSEQNLEENEKYILDNIKNNKIKDINIITFEKKVINDCKNANLLEEKKSVMENIKKRTFAGIFTYILIILGFFCLPALSNKLQSENETMSLLLFGVMLIMFLAMIIFPYAMATYIKSYYVMNKLDPYVRSKQARDINIKLEGLKKYIKEYSLLDEKEYKDIVLWENYLIYSVILGQNNKIVEEIMKKIK